MVQLRTKLDLRLACRGIGEQEDCGRLGDALRESVVEDQSIVACFSEADFMFALGHLVGLTFADPFDLFQPNAGQFVNRRRLCLGLLFVLFIGGVGRRGRVQGCGRAMESRQRAWVLEQPEVD